MKDLETPVRLLTDSNLSWYEACPCQFSSRYKPLLFTSESWNSL